MYIIDRYYHTKKRDHHSLEFEGPILTIVAIFRPILTKFGLFLPLKCIKHFIRLTNCYSYSITTKSWVWKLEKYIFYTILRCYLKIFGWFFKLCVHLITLRERWCLTLWLSKSRDWVLFFFSGFNWKFRIMLLPLSLLLIICMSSFTFSLLYHFANDDDDYVKIHIKNSGKKLLFGQQSQTGWCSIGQKRNLSFCPNVKWISVPFPLAPAPPDPSPPRFQLPRPLRLPSQASSLLREPQPFKDRQKFPPLFYRTSYPAGPLPCIIQRDTKGKRKKPKN